MIINDKGLAIIKRFERDLASPETAPLPALKAYLCPVGKWTIGWGHTGDVKLGDKITEHQADVILTLDLLKAETAVARACPKANGNQSSAMVCLAFNIGCEEFAKSTLVAKVAMGMPLAAAAEFLRWNKGHVDGVLVELPGLTTRRAVERALFLEPVS